nr:VWA domain-containing protein [uncultured Halomonas sp.]
MQHTNPLSASLPIVAAAYGRKLDVSVMVGSDPGAAYTDGNTIVVPNVSTEDFPESVIWGFLAHEAAHVRYTDFSVRRTPGLHASLTNVLEDARIERQLVVEYPGVSGDLDAIWDYLIDEELVGRVTSKTPEIGVLQMYSLFWLRALQLGQACVVPLLDEATPVFEATFSEGLQNDLHDILRKVEHINSTLEASMLAYDIIDLLQNEADKEPQEPSPPDQQDDDEQEQCGDDASQDESAGNSGDSEDGSSTDSAPPSDDSADDENEDDTDSSTSENTSDSGDGDTDSGSATSSDTSDTSDDASDGEASSDSSEGSVKGAGASNAQDTPTPSQLDAAAKVLADDNDAAGIADPVNALREQMQAEQAPHLAGVQVEVPTAQDALSNPVRGRAIEENAKAVSVALRQQLMGLVQAQQRSGRRTARRGKRIDARRVHRVLQGDTRVFTQRDDATGPNAAVQLVVDTSGSMQVSPNGLVAPINVVREAAMALALAFDSIHGVSLGVSSFGCHIESVLSHKEALTQEVKGRFAMPCGGTTAMAEAMWHGATELAQCRAPRKVMIVLSDGAPNSPSATTDAVHSLSDGIEFVGIGICDSAIASYIENTTVIHDVSDLKAALFAIAKEIVTAA